MPPFDSNPSALLERVFERIGRERFEGVEILNRALGARAVGFERHAAGWTGVMLTPWFMNLMVLPAAGQAWTALPVGTRRLVQFPAGPFEMLGGEEDELGPYLYCPMVSTMSAFATQEEAEAVARQLAAQMHDPATAESVRQMNPTGMRWHAPAPPAEAGTSRRDFLRGRFAAGGPTRAQRD